MYNYKRRPTRAVKVGNKYIGGDSPIVIQSMANVSTLDTEACAEQALKIAQAGGELVRFTTQGVREASNLDNIRKAMSSLGCDVPISADVHFNPNAAFEALKHAEKVRINPGNFVDAARTFRKLTFTDEEYAAEIDRIRKTLIPFLNDCREHGCAVRLGVNHGSLSDRIMSRYGDTPAGMVESVMEFLHIADEIGFKDIVISIKASNTTVMVETVRLLVDRMDAEGMDFPLHLGVTEAGDAEDGRIKSAVGIGALLADGIGDTIRVSLSEPPENEIPVATLLRNYISKREGHEPILEPELVRPNQARSYSRRLPGEFFSFHTDSHLKLNDIYEVDAASNPLYIPFDGNGVVLLRSDHVNAVGEMKSWIDRYAARGGRMPVILNLRYDDTDLDTLRVKAGADAGALLLSGYGSGLRIYDRAFDKETLGRLELDILQAARLRISKTEYIACPSCGRTLFDLETTLREVKEATAHLKGLKIGVMGCIVNGPGEMADADFGYVGAGPGRVSLYRGKECVIKNIPAEEALPELLKLIESSNND